MHTTWTVFNQIHTFDFPFFSSPQLFVWANSNFFLLHATMICMQLNLSFITIALTLAIKIDHVNVKKRTKKDDHWSVNFACFVEQFADFRLLSKTEIDLLRYCGWEKFVPTPILELYEYIKCYWIAALFATKQNHILPS